tara:strand:+ start:186 stop:2393 length:2208 start_codon:yes stop_codon:yes gene_type:complete
MMFERMTKGRLKWNPEQVSMAAIFVGALSLRLFYLMENRGINPFFDAPIVDARSYLELAQRIVGGDWMGGDIPFWQPPAFPYLLALVVGICGDSIFTAARVGHAILGASSALLVYRLARRPCDRATATLAAVGTALYGPLLYFEAELLSVALEVFLYLLLLLMLARAQERNQPLDWLLAGLTAGLATITRPNVLIFVLLFAILRFLRVPQSERRIALGRLLVAAGGLAIILAPVTLRNAVVGGEFVLISANGGVNFHIGNHAQQDSMVAIHPGVFWERLVAEPLAAGYSSAGQRSSYFYRRGISSIVDDPGGWLRLMARKTWRLVQGPEIKRNQDLYYARTHSRVLSILLWDRWLSFPHGLVAPLAMLGLILSWRRRHDSLDLLRTFLAGYSGSVLLFFVTSRYRVPLVPVAMVFAAIALRQMLVSVRTRNWRRVAGPAGVLITLIIAVNVPKAPAVEEDAQLQHDLGEVMLRKRHFSLSLQHSRQALVLEPEYPSAWHNIAVAQLALHHPQQAEAATRHALDQHSLRADTRILLARALLAQERVDEALAELEQAIRQEPEHGEVRYAVGRVLLQMGRHVEAVKHLKMARRLRPFDYWTHYDLGRALHANRQSNAALFAFEQATALAPHLADALSAAGAVVMSSGDLERARHLFERALQADPEYLPARINLGLLEIGASRYAVGISLLEAVVDDAVNPGPLWQALASAYQATGQLDKARAALKTARAQQPKTAVP